MATSSVTPISLAVTEVDPSNPYYTGLPSTQINFWTSMAVGIDGITPGATVSLSGTGISALDVTNATVVAVYGGGGGGYANLVVLGGVSIPAGTFYALAGTATITNTGITMSRAGNVVTVTTATPHNLQVGYLAQITAVPASGVGGLITSIVIDNEDDPGLATVTTTSPHGLVPGCFVSLTNIPQVAIGGGITAISWNGGIVAVVTAAAHGLSPGSLVNIFGTTNYDAVATVLNIVNATTFTYAYTPLSAPAPESSGTVSLSWPVPDTPDPTYFEVLTAPKPDSFQVQLNYADSTFVSGDVTYAWDGTFYVKSVPSATTFTYQQYGPNAVQNAVGTVTPYGQAAPGLHQCQVLFLTRNGAITRPSPPVNVELNGGQYVSVSNLPIGPPNVVARILAFTGAQGANFFYIPVPAEINGQIVSTATQVDDNTSTTAFLDFSDNTLFAALGISIPGNTPANQITLDGALGFGFYASRLITWGQRNILQNLLAMSFDGGYLTNTPTIPLGWNATANVGGALATGWFGYGWQITLAGTAVQGQLSQPMYQDAYGNPIATASTTYAIRGWFKPGAVVSDIIFKAKISSVSASFSTTAEILIPAGMQGIWLEAPFSAETPVTIPSDLTLTIWATASSASTTLLVDRLSIFYAEIPYGVSVLNFGYTVMPEGGDGVCGVAGSTDDTQKVMAIAQIRDTAYMLTQDPGGRLHEFADNGVTEPSGWTFRQLATNCGLVSVFALSYSQADTGTASGGEQWFTWAGTNGAFIFGGGQVDKISQEIEPDWRGAGPAGASQWSSAGGMNPANLTAAWCFNDPAARVIYFGIPQVPT